ncbi:MAG: hypothetical protein RJQ00_03090 [Vicingaceae bacterium]
MNNSKYKRIILFIISSSIIFFSFKIDEKVKGWFLAGSSPSDYEIGITQEKTREGKVAFLKSTENKIKGFGTIMQSFDSKSFNGKKVKLSGYIKSSDVKNWAGMWMRVDKEEERAVSFDNMEDRPIKGTTDWVKYEIILDVPPKSKLISYGVLLVGTGEVLIDNFNFKIVGESEEKTGRTKLEDPSNTDFEE